MINIICVRWKDETSMETWEAPVWTENVKTLSSNHVVQSSRRLGFDHVELVLVTPTKQRISEFKLQLVIACLI